MSWSHDIDDACDLAALYSLGALDAGDVWRFRAHLLDGCVSCEEDLESFEVVAGSLAYAGAAASPSPILRDRLFDAISESNGLEEFASVEAASDWEPYKIPGISIRRLHVDERTREAVLLVRAMPGVRYPSHRHAGVEEMFMLEGELRFGDRVYRPGDYVRSDSGSIHVSSETQSGCMFLLRASLDNELLN